MYMSNVGKERTLQEGITQKYFKVDTYEIIVSKVEKDTSLRVHKHLESQVGILLKGSFIFITDKLSWTLNEIGDNYIIESNIQHSAKALEDFYALDFKYISSENAVESNKNILVKNKKEFFEFMSIKYIDLSFTDITLHLKPSSTYYIISNSNLDLLNENISKNYTAMSIFEVKSILKQRIVIKKVDAILIILEYKGEV